MVNFPTRIPDCDSHSPALLDLFISPDTSICSTMAFPPSGNSDHTVVSVSIDFPANSKQDAPFHRIAYDCSRADWDGLRDHLRDILWDDILKLSASAAASEFCEWFGMECMYITVIVSIRSNLAHLHGFQLLVLLPWFVEITFFVNTNRINLLNLKFKQANNRCKRVFEAAKLTYATKTNQSINSQQLGSRDFWRIANSVLNKVKSAIPPLFNSPEVLSSASDKAKLFEKTFLRTLILMTRVSFYLFSLLKLIRN